MTRRRKITLTVVIGIILTVIAPLFGGNIYRQITGRSGSENVPTSLASKMPSTVEALAQKSGCLECHGVDQKIIGPAFRDIAARYKDDKLAREALIETVKNGGKGNWTEVTGGVLMPPYSPRLSAAEIEQLVDWVLGL